jgi:ribosomal protein S12 methylthiotransferase
MSKAQIGRKMRVLVDQPLVARSAADSPDVDARVLLSQPAAVGEFIDVEIFGTQVYDLLGRPL